MPLLTRRRLALGAATLLAAGPSPARTATILTAVPAADEIASLERLHGGRLGVYALDTGTGAAFAYRADERFLLASTIKGILAALALSRVDAGRDSLAAPVPYGPRDMLPVSPVTRAHLAEGRLSVDALCQAILVWSDNTAANLLLARVGGPPALTAYLRGLGDGMTRCDRLEPVGGWSGDRDTTTPHAIAGLVRTIVLGDALRPESRLRLERWMAMAVTGRRRLRAMLPPDWTACDRTGTADGVCNDYVVARRPHAAPLVIAAYHDAPGLPTAIGEAVLRQVGTTVVRWAGAVPRVPKPSGPA